MTLTDCPTCDRSFETVRGMAVHHARVHPEAWRSRFWHYVDRGGPDECWEWQGTRNWQRGGYGQMSVGGDVCRAHRLSYRLANGEPPDGHVLHHCDNPACVNPGHLYEGDYQDNVDDMWERGRGLAGEDTHLSKLTEGEVVEIREKYAATDVSQSDLAGEYGVSQPTVSRIVRGDIWESARQQAEKEERRRRTEVTRERGRWRQQ